MNGQAIAELAILLPLLLLLLLGVEELGRLIYTGITTRDAAHAGALYGAQNRALASDSPGMVQAALADAPRLSGLTATATHVCTCGNGASAPGCSLSDCPSGRLLVYTQVATSATFTPVCKLLGWPSPMQVQGNASIEAGP